MTTADDPNSSGDSFNTNWREQALQDPCSSCTGRACTICSIRTGDTTNTSGLPSGYAPRVLELYSPKDTTSIATPNGFASAFASDPLLGQPQALRPNGVQEAAVQTPSGTGVAQAAATANATSTNPIVLENMKPGTPESVWLIGQADTSIEGYAAQFTINHGNTVDFKINTDATNYRIDIYRLGYYGGDGATLVTSITKNLSSPQIQPDPLFDPTTKLVDAGNWSVSASWDIPADAVSGVYVADLTRLDTGGENMIPFVVRDDEDAADITFQTSDETWEAYNWWGGYNLYGGIDDGGHAGRADAVSYNRPFVTRDGGFSAGPQDYIFGEEYPAIRWLEENGYDVTYISGIDTSQNAPQLLNDKIFLSVGHDEYWSADQRANVEAARDAGVNLAFLSGNEVYWETRWENSIDAAGTPYKTLVSYKETWSNADTDVGNTTSTWRDPEFGAGDPENSLTGTIYTVDSYRLDTIQIPYDLSQFRFWDNTAVQDIQPGQVYSLTPNLLGYEWDSDLDNGSRPAGLIDLSSTTVNVNTLLLDNGNTTGPGTATHSLTLYRDPQSGALVFGAGTVYWTWGLDSHHDNEQTPTDPNVQQAMVNLFADMGVQPDTLMQSLMIAQQSTDLTAPTSTITPLPSGTSIVAAQPLTITGTAVDTGGGKVAVVEVSTDGGTTWHRADGFENWSYTFTPLVGGSYHIESRAVDDSVNMETPGAGITINVQSAPLVGLFSPSDVPTIPIDSDVGLVTLGMKFTSTQAGTIVGVRYYKSAGDGGTHVGSLWSSTGQLLATATFTQESASGWQTVTFDNPVSIAAGTTYIVSYHSNAHYADTPDYFTSAHTNGPLTAQAGNGYYVYGTDNAFPTNQSGNNTNYWVDPIFSSAQTANLPPVGTNDNGFEVASGTPMTFTAAQLLANDSDPNGDILSISGVGAASNGTVSFNSQTNTITFTPKAGYLGPASFGYSISDGRGGTGSAIVNLTVINPEDDATLFSSTDTPNVLSDPDSGGINLGVRFSASANGTITGIRYYKGANDTGTHTGSLWSANGTLLATVTFTNEGTSGWQTATFSNPVAITAGTTYVASFHSNGHYTATSGYFTTAHVNGVLTAPADGGVYAYGDDNLFPTSTFNSNNYWVDVVFDTGGGANTNQPPVANNDTGFTTPQDNTLTIAASALLANDTDPDGNTLTITGAGVGVNGTASYLLNSNTVTFTPNAGYTGPASFTYMISDGHGGTASATVNVTVTASSNHPPVAVADSGFTTTKNLALTIAASALLANDIDQDGDVLTIIGANGGVNGTASYNAQTNVVTFTPVAGYTGPASFNYTISDGKGGTALGVVNLNITAPANQPPVAVNDSGPNVTENTPLTIAASSLLSNDSDPDGDTLAITGIVGGSAVNGVAVFNSVNNTITFTPTAGYTGPASFQYTVSDGRGGTASATVSLNVAATAPTVSLFSGADQPAKFDDPDSVQLNLGVSFTTSQNGLITGIKYYKGANDTGVHTGSLWTSSGTLLASATFTNETASGWQTVTFSTPIAVTAGTTYVASFHSNGHYTSTNGFFSATYTNGPLTVGTGNGLYTYGNDNLFPTSTFGATNYWVDVSFSPTTVGADQPPIAANDSGFNATQNAPLVITAGSLLANDKDPDGDPLSITGVSGATHGTATFNAQTNMITFNPDAGYTGAASFNYAIADGRGGTASASVALTVNAASSSLVSLFSPTSTPSVVNANDPNPVELGFKFQASTNGDITGIKFYKGAQNTGIHVADLWSANGTLLATATFTNETASGWQEVDFSSPVTITAGTTYIASYHTSGFYSSDPGLFANPVTNGPLTAPAAGNGVYAYGTNSLFPTNNWNSTSYGVDVVFRPQIAA